MKTIYLHVGNFKTGTSAIQEYCSSNRIKLAKAGVDYLETARPVGNNTNHSKLSLSLVSKHGGRTPPWFDNNESFEEISTLLLNEIDASSCSKLIVSSEEFYRLPGLGKNTIPAIKSELQKLFSRYEVKVIMYVRDPLAFAKSWYNEVNKSQLPCRRFIDFFYFLDKALLLPDMNAKFWRDCFGQDSLILVPYNKKGAEHIREFITLTGAEVPQELSWNDSPVNIARDEGALEYDRLSKISVLDSKNEREKFLRSFVLSSKENFEKLADKIDFVNNDFLGFCTREQLQVEGSFLSPAELLIHDEKVNRRDIVSVGNINPWIIRLKKSRLVNFIKRIRGVLRSRELNGRK